MGAKFHALDEFGALSYYLHSSNTIGICKINKLMTKGQPYACTNIR